MFCRVHLSLADLFVFHPISLSVSTVSFLKFFIKCLFSQCLQRGRA
jgi:hypothetical protein